MGTTTATHTRSGTSVIRRSNVQPRAWVGPTTNKSQPNHNQKSEAHDDLWLYNQNTPDDGHSNYPQTGKKQAHPQPTQQPLMLENSQKGQGWGKR